MRSVLFVLLVCAPVLLATGATHVLAAEAKCSTVSTSETVAVVVCPKPSNQSDWKAGGIAACRLKAKCNAWIWDDPGLAPKVAPDADGDLDKAVVATARAVWINNEESMILLRKVK